MKNFYFEMSLVFIPQFSKFTNAILSIKGQARNSLILNYQTGPKPT